MTQAIERQQLTAMCGSFLGVLLWLPVAADGQIIASDNADPNDPAYVDGWQAGDNGGFGFGPWAGGIDSVFMHEIDTDPFQPDNDLGAPAFRFGAEYQTAVRPFANPMAAGQTFKMDFDQFAYDPADPAEGVYTEQDSLISFRTTVGERFALYNWIGKYTFGGQTTVYNADEWGIGADSAFDNLHGGAPLPMSGGLFKPGYTGPDSQDGFSLSLELPTLDTYRLKIVDDGVTKVDVSGELRSSVDPDGGGPEPPVDVTGQPLASLLLWFTPGDFAVTEWPAAYFTNLQIVASPGLDGDYNGNGTVDAADYVLWRNDSASFGGAAGYDTWRSHFGQTGASGGGLQIAAVPEPTAVVALLVGTAAATTHVRRRRPSQVA